jgi:hypothetical protein
MLATIISDAYRESEKREISEAITAVTYYDCWSSSGIYCFWDFYTNEILYIGLSNDLSERFKQHNNLIKCSPKSCKHKDISEYFVVKGKLGFTLMLQSSFVQPLTRKYIKRRKIRFDDPNADFSNILEDRALKEIRLMESLNIESVKQRTGFIPKWNTIGGGVEGRKNINHELLSLFELLCNKTTNDNVSRASIRELHQNGEYRIFECFLHGLRISPLPLKQSLELNIEIGNDFIIQQMHTSNYLKKKLSI